jgi:hypothetical protein
MMHNQHATFTSYITNDIRNIPVIGYIIYQQTVTGFITSTYYLGSPTPNRLHNLPADSYRLHNQHILLWKPNSYQVT